MRKSADLARGRAAGGQQAEQLRRLARLMDSSFTLPGGFRIGLDGIIGLIPGVGDAVGAIVSTYIVVQSARLGASTPYLMRMMLNIVVDTVIGVVPVVGDIFDFAWKANERNMKLLEAHLGQSPARGSARRRLSAASIVLLVVFILLVILALVGLIQLVVALWGALAA